ncbi:MAG: hypothetical protein JWO94_3464 [Verrucomicrobiaceae bacterium]|nr:hypothetical protein [Verrucomicrobiaceae bacterium]
MLNPETPMKTKTERPALVPRTWLAQGALWLAGACLALPSQAQQPQAAVPSATPPAAMKRDPDLPQPFDTKILTPMIANSPFNRAVNLSDSLVLTGMATVDGKAMVTLMDKELKRTYVVTDEPNENGWKLAEVPPQVELKKAQVKINIGSEVVTIRHDREGQEESMKKDKHSPGGNPGQRDPSGNDRGYKRGPRTGPTPEQREKWDKLSDGAKEKMKGVFRDNRERLGSMTEEQRRTFIESNFKSISEADAAASK